MINNETSNAQLEPYIQNHITLMTGNAYYTLPVQPAGLPGGISGRDRYFAFLFPLVSSVTGL